MGGREAWGEVREGVLVWGKVKGGGREGGKKVGSLEICGGSEERWGGR